MEGTGTPLLLLHGFTGSHEYWHLHHEYWRDRGYQIIAPDLLGHGLTDTPADSWRYQMSQVGADIRALLDELNIQRCHILGYSMGGRLALYLARYYPTYFERLVIESASPGLATEGGRTARERKDARLADFIDYSGIVKFVTYWEALPMRHSQKRIDLRIRNQLHGQRLKNVTLGLSNSLRGMGTGVQPSLWDEINDIQQPTLFLTGEEDTKFTYLNGFMTRLLPNSTHIVIPDSGHATNLEQPEVFWEKVFGFLVTNE